MAATFCHLVLSNWRNFKKVDVPLPQRVFIVGPNASGKTNLLDALRFLRDIASPGGSLVAAVKELRGLKHIRSLHAGGDSNILVEVHMAIDDDPNVWTYSLQLSGTETGKKPLRIEHERVSHGNEEILDRTRTAEADDRLLTQTHLEQISQSLQFRPLADVLASVVHVHVVPQVVRTPARAEAFSKRDAPGSDFIDQVARLSQRQKERALRRIEKL